MRVSDKVWFISWLIVFVSALAIMVVFYKPNEPLERYEASCKVQKGVTVFVDKKINGSRLPLCISNAAIVKIEP